MKINLNSLRVQFLIGMIANVAYVVILLITNYENVQLPVGDFQNNIWWGCDVMGYVQPAESFLRSGEFLRKGHPDFHRTVGYPFFLFLMMRIFGPRWLIPTYFIQAIVFAFAYPALTGIARILFPGKPKLSLAIFIFSLVSGAYFSYTAQILTDGLFAVCFITGLYFGLLSIARRSYAFLFLHLLFVGFAAQIRPMLSLYPLADMFFLVLIAVRNNEIALLNVKKMIAISFVVLAILCNGPSIRNYINYGIFLPADVLSNALSDYLAKPVLVNRGKAEYCDEMSKKFHSLAVSNNIRERIDMQNRFAFETLKAYPFITLALYSYNAFWNMFEFHWQNVLFYWRVNWLSDDYYGRYKGSTAALFTAVPWVLAYGVIYVFFLRFLYQTFVAKDWILLSGLFFFVLPLFISFIAGQGARMRLYAEGVILMCAFSSIHDYWLMRKDRYLSFIMPRPE